MKMLILPEAILAQFSKDIVDQLAARGIPIEDVFQILLGGIVGIVRNVPENAIQFIEYISSNIDELEKEILSKDSKSQMLLDDLFNKMKQGESPS